MKKDKILILKLFYKGEILDSAIEEQGNRRDIKDKFYIGSDKSLQWQILNDRFPKKHLLVKKAKDKFKLMLGKGMKLTVKKDGQNMEESELKSKKYLVGNKLVLDKAFTGNIKIDDVWSIGFAYATPVLTKRDARLVKEFQKFPEATSQEKLTRNLFIIAILLLLVFGFMFERYYEPPVVQKTIAQRVTYEVAPSDLRDIIYDDAPIAQPTDGADEGVADDVPAFDFSALVGGSGVGPGAANDGTPSEGLALATGGQDIIATGPGGPGGAGPGPGASGPGPGGGGDAFQTSAGPGVESGRYIPGLNVSGTGGPGPGGIGGEGSLEGRRIDTAGQLAALRSARQRQAAQGIQTVSEADLAEDIDPVTQASLANIQLYINNYWRQIRTLFDEESRRASMYGSLEITLYFSANGQVEAVNLQERRDSSFTDSFKARAIETMMQWRVPTQEQLPAYTFARTFVRS